MRIAIVLPGLHRVVRGAEIAFEAIAKELEKYEDCELTLFGSGPIREHMPYKFVQVKNRDRKYFEKWLQLPIFRNEYIYEEFSFILDFTTKYNPENFDVTITCSYPFVNWILRIYKFTHKSTHIFVTQNSDYPAITSNSEYMFFGCDGLVCTNPQYFERNKERWLCDLITNGVDTSKFYPGEVKRSSLGLPEDCPMVLMVSALIPSKRISVGIQAIAELEGVHLVVCGDGSERDKIKAVGEELLAERFHLKHFTHEQIPDVYRAADAFMHLSIDEPFGNVYLEALATGLPIIAHDRDVTQWILEDTAILADTTKLSLLLEAIRTALLPLSKKDSNRRIELINRRFSWSIIGLKYYKFIRKIANTKNI